MEVEKLISNLPDYAFDIKNNLTELLNAEKSSNLSKKNIAAIAVAASLTTTSVALIETMEILAGKYLSEEEMAGAKTAHALMSMTNVYYSFTYAADDPVYKKMLSGLQMRARKNPGIEKRSYEFAALAVSAINNCKECMNFHESQLRKLKVEPEEIQICIKLAAVISATGQLLKFKTL